MGLLGEPGPAGAADAPAGINWSGFSRWGYPDGLDRHPYHRLAGRMEELGYGAVRLPWAENVLERWDEPILEPGVVRHNGRWTVGRLFIAVLEELAARDFEIILDYHPQKAGGGDDQDFRGRDVPGAWRGLLAKLRRRLSKTARARIVGADVYNEPRLDGDQAPYRAMVLASLDAILSFPEAFPNLKGVVEPCDGAAVTWAGSDPWWLLRELSEAGFGPDRVNLEFHYYPWWHPIQEDPWEGERFAADLGVELGALPFADVAAVLQHRVQQAQDWGYSVLLGEYGHQDDAWGGAVARAAEALGIPRFRWRLLEDGEYGVVDADAALSENGRKSPAAELEAGGAPREEEPGEGCRKGPGVASDCRSLAEQPEEVQQSFAAAYGEEAAARWAWERDRDLAEPGWRDRE
ncbi:MAG: cellulase family glycosylhydrolase [Elusimicrobia bacterium]|nr:cellulase family glycosylhydrolase [Elusimicrobiota bacterium]